MRQPKGLPRRGESAGSRRINRTPTEVVSEAGPALALAGTSDGEPGTRHEAGKALGCLVGSKFSFLHQHRRRCHQRNTAASVQALAARTSWCRFNITRRVRNRAAKPDAGGTCFDFNSLNRLARPALLVGSWVHCCRRVPPLWAGGGLLHTTPHCVVVTVPGAEP